MGKAVKSGVWSSLKKSLGFKGDTPSPSVTKTDESSPSDDDDDEESDASESEGYEETPKGAYGGKKKTPRALKRIKPSSGWVDYTEGEIKRKHPLSKKKKD